VGASSGAAYRNDPRRQALSQLGYGLRFDLMQAKPRWVETACLSIGVGGLATVSLRIISVHPPPGRFRPTTHRLDAALGLLVEHRAHIQLERFLAYVRELAAATLLLATIVCERRDSVAVPHRPASSIARPAIVLTRRAIVVGELRIEALPLDGILILRGLVLAHSPERLVLLASDDPRVGAAQALELQVLPDSVVEQAHAPPNHTRLAYESCVPAARLSDGAAND
jgi:hypothetical protein